MKKVIIGIAIVTCVLAVYAEEVTEPSSFQLIWIYFCLSDSNLLPGDTVCSSVYGNWIGTVDDDSTCYGYILRMCAHDSSALWRSTEIYNCRTSGFDAVAWEIDDTSHLWLTDFVNLNTYEDGSPWTDGFSVGDCLYVKIIITNPTEQFNRWSTSRHGMIDTTTIYRWRFDDPMGDVYLKAYLFPPHMDNIAKNPVVPGMPSLAQNSPNPFNANTEIAFTLPVPGHVKLEITDVLGKHVATLMNAEKLQGNHIVRWIGTDDEGNEVPSGVYFYKLTVGDESIDKKKMTLIK